MSLLPPVDDGANRFVLTEKHRADLASARALAVGGAIWDVTQLGGARTGTTTESTVGVAEGYLFHVTETKLGSSDSGAAVEIDEWRFHQEAGVALDNRMILSSREDPTIRARVETLDHPAGYHVAKVTRL